MFMLDEKPPCWQEHSLVSLLKGLHPRSGFSLSVNKDYMIRGTVKYLEFLWATGRLSWDRMQKLADDLA